MTERLYVIDTSVCLTDSSCIYHYGDNDIIIPMKVLEEIDNHKKRQDSVGVNARNIIRDFDSLREKGSLQEGVSLGDLRGTLKVARVSLDSVPPDFNKNEPDHIIITTALEHRDNHPDKEVILVSRDINMRVIADSLGLQSEDYVENKVIKIRSELYTGYKKILVSDEEINYLYKDSHIPLAEEEMEENNFNINDSVMLVSECSEKKTALCRYRKGVYEKIPDYNKRGVWGVKPRNKEQVFALDLLMDATIPLVTLVGKAGSGKTLLAIAAGISQTISDPFSGSDPLYNKIVVSRPIQPLGKDIGYLPGTMEEKMHPWLMPLQDNLQFLLGNDKATLEEYMEKGIIEIEALTYIRGRSISNAYIIIDEAQNLSLHEIKTILTRVGENTKIVLTGDIEQIDNVYVDETSNGLVHAVENFKEYDLSGHITLQKGERSSLATLASKIL
jgi:PhoH-like ATPase